MSSTPDSTGTLSPPPEQEQTPIAASEHGEDLEKALDREYGPKPDVIKAARSQGALVLSNNVAMVNGMHFQSQAAAMNFMNDARWQSPVNDLTIPKTDEDERRVVQRLVHAFFDMRYSLDSEGNAYRKRLTPGQPSCAPYWTVEKCAWIILGMVKAVHTQGFAPPIFDTALLKNIGQTAEWTFEDRIGMICRVLRVSKNMAHTVMKYEKSWTMIGAPHKLFDNAVVNSESNRRRNKWVKQGRAADNQAAYGSTRAGKRRRAVSDESPAAFTAVNTQPSANAAVNAQPATYTVNNTAMYAGANAQPVTYTAYNIQPVSAFTSVNALSAVANYRPPAASIKDEPDVEMVEAPPPKSKDVPVPVKPLTFYQSVEHGGKAGNSTADKDTPVAGVGIEEAKPLTDNTGNANNSKVQDEVKMLQGDAENLLPKAQNDTINETAVTEASATEAKRQQAAVALVDLTKQS